MICDKCEKKNSCTAMIYLDIKKSDDECDCFVEKIEDNDDKPKNIFDIYVKAVKEADEKGFADTYKKATELLLKDLKLNNFHAKDVEYSDGYYIFGSGTNSKVKFKLKECKGWLFGIWWDESEDNRITGEVFTQYEETIDKFKPFSSQIRWNITVDLSSIDAAATPAVSNEEYKMINEIKFIQDEPELAFCRDYYYWDYNEEYHTREDAQKAFKEYKDKRKLRIKYEKMFDKKVINFLSEVATKVGINNVKMIDKGECWAERYELVADIKDNKDIVDVPGCYDLFDPESPEQMMLRDEYDKIVNDCTAKASEMGFYWFSPMSDTIIFRGDEIDEEN